MTERALFEYEAFDASPRLKPTGECILTFLTDGGSVLIRMPRVVFDGLLQRAEQEVENGPPPATP